jgi:hypothetical protein
VIARKVSQCSKNQCGAEAFAVASSVVDEIVPECQNRVTDPE